MTSMQKYTVCAGNLCHYQCKLCYYCIHVHVQNMQRHINVLDFTCYIELKGNAHDDFIKQKYIDVMSNFTNPRK